MNIGAMRDRVAIIAVTSVTDGIGGFTNSTATLDTVWAKVEPMSGSRQTDFEQIVQAQGYTITIRQRTDVTTAHLLTLPDGQKLTIHSITRDFKNREFMTITAYA